MMRTLMFQIIALTLPQRMNQAKKSTKWKKSMQGMKYKMRGDVSKLHLKSTISRMLSQGRFSIKPSRIEMQGSYLKANTD